MGLASISGRVQLVERPVTAEECGCAISDLRTGGRGLHKVKPVYPLLINHIAINLPHRIGGVEVFW